MKLEHIAARFGTPAYVYDLAAVRRAHADLRLALPGSAVIYYSLKANPHPRLVAELAGLGCRLINTARSGPIDVAWHHGGPLFAHPVELHQHNDVIDGMHARLVALRG